MNGRSTPLFKFWCSCQKLCRQQELFNWILIRIQSTCCIFIFEAGIKNYHWFNLFCQQTNENCFLCKVSYKVFLESKFVNFCIKQYLHLWYTIKNIFTAKTQFEKTTQMLSMKRKHTYILFCFVCQTFR